MSRTSDKEKIRMWTDISKTASLDRIAEAKERLADANDPKLKAKEELKAQKKLDEHKRKEDRKDYLRSIRKENRATLSIIFVISLSIFAYSEFNNEITGWLTFLSMLYFIFEPITHTWNSLISILKKAIKMVRKT
tara:strand:+ start:510 stop:914 length:405 start_codon:yes stop_codon:yes gene_type:complete